MSLSDILNIIAIVLSPIIAVVVGQILQNNEKKRADKMEIFKTLMMNRGQGWSMATVRSLNVIEVVFSNNEKVLRQWKIYHDKLLVENPSDTELVKIKNEGDKLLEVMAASLGYKDTITWETIQQPYIPNGLIDMMSNQSQYMDSQLIVMNGIRTYMEQMSKKQKNDEGKDNGQDENGINKHIIK